MSQFRHFRSIGLALTFLFLLMETASAVTCSASWYGGGEKLNRKTANGEVFRPSSVTCAHRSAPFGTKFKVVNLSNGRSVICRVNDRGPARATGRCIDLARGAALKLDMIRHGVTKVRLIKLR